MPNSFAVAGNGQPFGGAKENGKKRIPDRENGRREKGA